MLDETGRQLGSSRVDHGPEGLAKLTPFLEQLTGPDKEQVACLVETNRGVLIAFLLEGGWPVSPVNPRSVDRRRSASGATTATIDADVLAKTGRADFAALRRLPPESELIAELTALTRDQEALLQMQTRLVNQLTACLQASDPVALSWFAGALHQPSTLVFRQSSPTPQAAVAASGEQLTQVLTHAGHPTATQVAPKLFQTLHQPHVTAHASTTRPKSRVMLAWGAQLLPLVEQIAASTKAIDTLLLTHPDRESFAALPGAGKRLAPR